MQAPHNSLAGIQILRAVAAFMVVMQHTLREMPTADWIVALGGAGVDIFFVISGFIMVYVTFPAGGAGNAVETPRTFFAKRLTRIGPLYWAVLIFILLLSRLGLYQHLGADLDEILRCFFFVPTERRILIVSWTLVYEMYFYVLFALSLFLRGRAATILGVTALISGMFYLGGFIPDAQSAAYIQRPISLEFVAGMGLAFVFKNWPRFADYTKFLWVFGFAGMIAAHAFFGPDYAIGWAREICWGIPAVLIVASMLSLTHARNATERAMVMVGDASYALYLTHPLVMISYAWVIHHAIANTLPLQIAFAVPAVIGSIVFALIAHRWLELPLVGLARKLLGLSNKHSKPDPTPVSTSASLHLPS